MKWFSGWAFPDSALDPLRAKCDAGILPAQSAGGDARVTFPMIGSWSLGTFQALDIAANNPVSVGALVLVSSTPRFCATSDFPHGLPEQNLRAMQRSFTRDPRTTLENFHKLCADPAILSDDELADLVEKSLSLGGEMLAAGLRDLREKDFRNVVAQIKVPVLLLHGEDDGVIPVGASKWLAANFPDAKLVTLHGAGHDLPVRHADWVATEIAKFAGEIA